MTTASTKAYLDPENKERRKTHREIVKDSYFFAKTIREASVESGLTYNQVQKRTSELLEYGEIMIVNEKMEEGNNNSVFIVTGNKKEVVKKQSLKDFLKEHYPHILVEYNGRNNHKIN
jgi:hypothetical protein